MPSADYIWPHTMNKRVREVVTAEGGEIVGEEYFPLDHTDYERIVEDIMSSGAEVVFNTIVPPGLTPFLEQLHNAGFTTPGRAHRLHLLRRELPEPGAGRARRGPVRMPGLLPGRQGSVQHRAAQPVRELYPGQRDVHCRSACSGMYRGLKLWEAAVNEAGSLDQDDVIGALDHARIAQGPGGPPRWCPASTMCG